MTDPISPSPSVVETRAPRLPTSECIEAAALLVDAAPAVFALARAAEAHGLARRLDKLARQLVSAGRLLAGGNGLETPPAAISARSLARRATAVVELADVDATIAVARVLIVALHDWRGHTACVPEAARH